MKLAFGWLGNMQFEVIEPTSGKTLYQQRKRRFIRSFMDIFSTEKELKFKHMNSIEKYFNAEKYESLPFVLVGLTAIGFAIYFLSKLNLPFYIWRAKE
jgi:hypothetical protein